jgi:hypothetical protein
MLHEDSHLPDMHTTDDTHASDEDLLLAADGELPRRRAAQVRDHLAACWHCRARMTQVEETIAEFVRAQRHSLDSRLPPIAGPRALLRAQLAELTAQPEVHSWPQFFHLTSAARSAAYIFAILLVVVIAGKRIVPHSAPHGESVVFTLDHGAVPDPTLTPGATRPVTISDVCSMPHEDVVRAVPTSVRQEVFQEYGIANAHANNYEIDYLITPGLGGADDIHNLWPESYTSSAWNAHTKDALEEHLHQMVCAGMLDLPAAQRAIATDWVAAYKKYFHTDRPLSPSSGTRS